MQIITVIALVQFQRTRNNRYCNFFKQKHFSYFINNQVVSIDKAGLTVSEAWGSMIVMGLHYYTRQLKHVAYIPVLNTFKEHIF